LSYPLSKTRVVTDAVIEHCHEIAQDEEVLNKELFEGEK
jgi:hypothetical protein